MPQFGYGLRAKSLYALVVATLLALIPTGFIAWTLVDMARTHFGEAYARNLTLLNRQKILAPISRELALSRRLAQSVAVRQWLLDEKNPSKKELAFQELESFQTDFRSHGAFIISHSSRAYYLNDPEHEYSRQPRYLLDTHKKDDAWFFASMASPQEYNINVDPDVQLGVTRIWFNVQVQHQQQRLGLAGTGLDLTRFLKDFIHTEETGVTPMILNEDGAIQAHPDARLIAYGSGAGDSKTGVLHTLADDIAPEQRPALQNALQQAKDQPEHVQTLWVQFKQRPKLLAVSHIPELRWHIVTVVDLASAQIVDKNWLYMAAGTLAVLFGILLAALAYGIDRLVLRPVRSLHHSATALAQGHFDVALPPPSQDELGELTSAFDSMARQIRANTEQLEDKVRARTLELEQANERMAASQKKIADSIDYASLIQRALLPDSLIKERLGPHHFVLWRPRDVVGGDFYLFRDHGNSCVIGVVDCAGHGVPGALMTMLARAAFDEAMDNLGVQSPAALLTRADQTLRSMLRESELSPAIATNMDAGLVFIDRDAKRIRFSGAKIALFWGNGHEINEIRGNRHPLGGRRQGQYVDADLSLQHGDTYYLVTDGYLDQAGGELGFSLGTSRFVDLLRSHAALPMDEQAHALDQALHDYRGDLPQRDDITLLSFRIE